MLIVALKSWVWNGFVDITRCIVVYMFGSGNHDVLESHNSLAIAMLPTIQRKALNFHMADIYREALSSLLGVLEESALQDVLARAENLRTWQLKLNATTESSTAAAVIAALGHQTSSVKPVQVVSPSKNTTAAEFGADLVIHAARQAGDPDAAVLAMCGALPGSDIFNNRCGAFVVVEFIFLLRMEVHLASFSKQGFRSRGTSVSCRLCITSSDAMHIHMVI